MARPDRRRRDPLSIYVGDAFATARKQQGLRLKDVGERVGVTAATIQHYEGGRSQLHLRQFLSLCVALDLDPVDMIAGVLQGGFHLIGTFHPPRDTR